MQELVSASKHKPVVNQYEIHPFLQREDIDSACRQHGIAISAYSPLAKAMRMDDPTLVGVAKKHGRSTAQVMIRWSMNKGYITLPKSVNPERIRQNIDVDFELDDEDMQKINRLNRRMTTGWDPTTWT